MKRKLSKTDTAAWALWYALVLAGGQGRLATVPMKKAGIAPASGGDAAD